MQLPKDRLYLELTKSRLVAIAKMTHSAAEGVQLAYLQSNCRTESRVPLCTLFFPTLAR